MKTTFAIRAASLAIAMSLAGVVHAQDAATTSSTVTAAPKGKKAPKKDEGTQTTQDPTPAPSSTESIVNTNDPKAGLLRYGDIIAFSADGVDPYYGNINPFYRDINAFWGNINPFYRDINAFWGNINPFYGDINAFWGDINAFWKDISAFDAAYLQSIGDFWKTNGTLITSTDTVWGQSVSSGASLNGYASVRDNLTQLVAQATAKFGARGFTQAEANQVLARHGINLNDLSTLQNKTSAQRSAFFIDWHDTVMSHAGIDHVDHWMSAVNWNPAVTQIQGTGTDSVVGIIDAQFGASAGLSTSVIQAVTGGTQLNGHGAAVASLIAGAHDGKGVMGIAPNSTITTYNPFAADGTATWDDIAKGIVALKGVTNGAVTSTLGGGLRASVINLSLGESGAVVSKGLADTFKRADVSAYNGSTVYVVAAGNDGITQTANVDWNLGSLFSKGAVAIFVGSVNPAGEISSFSNRPGTACLLSNGVCKAGNELYRNFIVAPGELLLVSDGQGGVVRRSGTSFAAPLVSGAITLLHDRWPWLAQHPDESAEIIFRSARDLGAPGPDPIYGWGMLDVTASQSPLDFNTMSFVLYQQRGSSWTGSNYSGSQLLAMGIPSWWETNNAFFTMFEKIGDTQRDFSVPVSTFATGKRTNALGRGFERLQDFVNERFATWIRSGGTDRNGDGKAGLTQLRSDVSDLSNGWNLRYDAAMPRYSEDGALDPVHSAARLADPSGKLDFTLGYGQGAMALSGERFGLIGDHDRDTGGVNPVLGFASGEFFAGAGYRIAPSTQVRVGYSDNRLDWYEVSAINAEQRQQQRELGSHQAHAYIFGLEQQISKVVTLDVQYTRLREDNALLGAQTTVEAFLGNGSKTDAVTVTTSFDVGNGITFDLSATGGRTTTARGQAFTSAGAALSTAGQASVTKRGVVGQADTLRVSLAQPLNVESGELELRSEQVVDRLTGETGVVTQRIGIATKRRIAAEAVYATPLSDAAEFGLFGRYVQQDAGGEGGGYMVGANLGWRF
ncbi:S8 family serine peptidase [Altererythrobacter sp. BO-6]|uniref:S8 family peptidase n=1 Tax=Altererythrobacter sp. BO-6 TaxID=2604537 RepID=UPI0013E13B48|nr:S8 family serine peptidase [Altererythrobacter sp. BO-6]QIG52926.1 S8 family serine peptidase [Altererythrobacter sp. BO-6]